MNGLVRALLTAYALVVLANVAFWALLLYITAHFIAKLW